MTRLRDDQPACLAPGTAGVHSDSYYDPDGGWCAWCGAEPIMEPAREVPPPAETD